jgi:signal transduction histidine kinase
VSQTSLLRSSVFRITLIYVLIFSVSVLVLFGFFYWSTVGYLTTKTDETINAEIQGLAERYRTDGFSGLHLQIAERLAKQQPGETTLYLLTDNRYQPMLGNIGRWPTSSPDPQGWLDFRLDEATAETEAGGHSGPNYMARARSFLIGNRYHLLVGRAMKDLQEAREQIIWALLWGMAITMGLALLGGMMMRRTLTRRLDAINRTSREIIGGNLRRRIPTRYSGDEFDELADNLNSMLDQIELGMDGVRRVSDNIAHDLKTPLARLRNRLEELRFKAQDEAEREQRIDQITAEADGLLATFNALLRIARIESSGRREGFHDIDVTSVIRDLQELYEPVIEEHNQVLELSIGGPIWMSADRDMLFQAFANLIDNAIKYTPKGGKIQIMTGVEEDRPVLAICDSGPGIPETEYSNVTQRFYRLDSSRSTPGSGLGLALAAAVIRLHNFEMRFSSNNPGLCVHVCMPPPSAGQPSRKAPIQGMRQKAVGTA